MKRLLLPGLLSIWAMSAFLLPPDDFITQLTRRLNRFKSETPQVKVHLVFNQNKYMPGDTAYFSVRFFTEDLLPVAGRQLLRLEISDSQGKIVFFENVAVKDGFGFNQVALPASLSPGVYHWVAYSSWMKNFSPEFYFQQPFVLVNDKAWYNELPDSKFEFFAEGGTLVTGITNYVVVLGAVDSQLLITDEAGSEIHKLQLDNDGLGSFDFHPLPGKSYYAVNVVNPSVRQPIPLGYKDGCSLHLFQWQQPARLEIRFPADTRWKQEKIWVVIAARSSIYFTAHIQVSDQAVVKFNAKDLPPGVCYATVFSEQGEILAERLFITNFPTIQTEIAGKKPVYSTRSEVGLQLLLKDELGNPAMGRYSVSVVKQELMMNAPAGCSITEFLQWRSEGSAPVFSNPSNADRWLISKSNKRIAWKDIISDKWNTTHSFSRLLSYKGKVVLVESGQPVPDSSRVIAYLQKNMIGYEAVTGKDGTFDLTFLFDFWNEDEIFFTVENKRGKELDARVIWETDSMALISKSMRMKEAMQLDRYASHQKNTRLIDRSYKFYAAEANIDKQKLTDDPNREFEDELSGADFTIRTEDYVLFPSMEELIREVIPSMQHRKTRGKATVKVVLPDGVIPTGGPLFIIDGIMTRQSDYFLQLKPANIISVKVVRAWNKINRFGSLGRNGIVLVHTRKQNHDPLKKSNSLIAVKGLNKPGTFEVSNGASADERIPQFHSTLYWNPDIKTDSFGKSVIRFSTSDDTGNYLIRIQGMTQEGKPFEMTDTLRVEFIKP